MEILSILDTLEDVVEKSVGVPFSGKSMVDKEELLELIKEIRLKLPDDIKQAKWVMEERQHILVEAQREAGNMIREAEGRVQQLIDEHEITRQSFEKARETLDAAQRKDKEIREGAHAYADSLLAEVQTTLEDVISVVRSNRQELQS